MEAFQSERALDDAVNEGVNMKSFPKTSLPQRQKRHIFEGLDTSWIARDILKIPGSSKRLSKMSTYNDQDDAQKPISGRKAGLVPAEKPRTPYFKPNQEYRSFVKDKETFHSLPVLSHRSADIPVSYNNFYSHFIENGRIKRDEETCNSREGGRNKPKTAENIKCGIKNICVEPISQNNVDCIPLDKLMLHIDDIKRLMGREKTVIPAAQQKSEISKNSTKSQSLYRYQPRSTRVGHPGSDKTFSRHGTTTTNRTVLKSTAPPARATTCTTTKSSARGFTRSIVSHVQKLPDIDDMNRNKLVPDITVMSPRERYNRSEIQHYYN